MFSSWKQLKPERVLGRGGCGKVSLVKPTKIAGASGDAALFYAVKNVNLEAVTSGAKDEEERTKLERMIFQEAELMKSLKHGNIVKVFSSFLENGEFNMVMEYCECGSLKQTIDRQAHDQPFSEEQICDWVAQIAMTLLYLHEKRILHRDIKPENILLTDNKNTVKLADFGIAKDLSSTMNKSAHTQIGTPTHMTPEVLSGESSYTYKSEVWSLGIVLFELMALQLPFPANPKAPTVTCVAVLTADIPKISKRLPYSQGLRDLLQQKMLVRKPELRISMSQVVAEPCLEGAVRKLTSKELQQAALAELTMVERRLELEKSLEKAIAAINRLERRMDETEVEMKQLAERNQRAASEKMATMESLLARILTKLEQVEEKYESLSSLTLEDAKAKLFNAVWEGNIDVVRKIFRSKLIDIDSKYDMPNKLYIKTSQGCWDFSGSTALLYASGRGHLDIVKTLLFEFTADINAIDEGGASALTAAAFFGHADVVNFLAENGAVIDHKDKWENTALISATTDGNFIEIIKALVVEYKADLETKNNKGLTALINAALHGNASAVRTLLDLGADVEAQRTDGRTALMMAAQIGHVEIARELVKRGPQTIDAVDEKGTTALMYASYFAKPDIVELLLKNGANPLLATFTSKRKALALAGLGAKDDKDSEAKTKVVELLMMAASGKPPK